MAEALVNGKACDSLVLTADTLSASAGTDPDGIEIDCKWSEVQSAQSSVKTSTASYEDIEHNARLWYDHSKYGQKFCVQAYAAELTAGTVTHALFGIYATKSTDKLEKVTFNGQDYYWNAYGYAAAHYLAAGAAMLATAAAYMQ